MGRSIPRWLALALGLFFALLAVAGTILALRWPFTEKAVIRSIRSAGADEVRIGAFREIFFPRPGCVAENVSIYQSGLPGTEPLITVKRLVLTADYPALLTFEKHLHEIRADGFEAHIPGKKGSSEKKRQGGREIPKVDRVLVRNGALLFESKEPGQPPFRIDLHEVVLSPASAHAPIGFTTSLHVPEPPGEVRATGHFGPWNQEDPYKTAVSGSYAFDHADLAKFNGIAGVLNSTGNFSGSVEQIEVNGRAQVPEFEVRSAGHRTAVATDFTVTVNGRTGDVNLNRISTEFLGTHVTAEGAVAEPSPGSGNVLSLRLEVERGRIQDLLRLVSGGPPGLTGTVNLRFSVRLPPGELPFLRKLEITGDMGVGGAKFTKPETQHGLEHISRNASDGEQDPSAVLSQLRGRIAVAHGIANLRGVQFQVPGASATLDGTYGLESRTVDLHGKVYLHEKLSKTTTGIKSFLLKALDPFFRRHKHLSVVAVRITGTYGHTSIGLD